MPPKIILMLVAHPPTTVNSTFFQPLSGLLIPGDHSRHCPEFPDENFLHLGVQRVLELSPSGQRRRQRTEQAEKECAKKEAPLSMLVLEARRATQRSVKFIRCCASPCATTLRNPPPYFASRPSMHSHRYSTWTPLGRNLDWVEEGGIFREESPTYAVVKMNDNSKLKPKFMKIEFTEDVNLALRKNLDGRATRHRRFKQNEVHRVEFLGEDLDAETIDVRFEDGYLALKVARPIVALRNYRKYFFRAPLKSNLPPP